MSFSGTKILVTGAGGFIGSHLVEELVRGGATVTALVHYNSRNDCGNLRFADSEIRDSVQILFGDIRDPFVVKRAVDSKVVVFHLAALIGIPYSYHAPQSYVETNILGTLNVLQAALEADVERVVHTSTSEVYGAAQYVPIDEKHPLVGQSPYSATKIGADKIAESFFRSFGVPVTTIRPFNTFGPRQSARAIIPTILSQLAQRRETIKIGSLEPKRDFTYVKDCVRGFLAIAPLEEAAGEVINIGSGEEVSIGELVDQCCKIAGYYPKIELDSARVRPEKSEVMRLLCDNSKAARIAGWQPQYPLHEGLAETLKFIQEYPGDFQPGSYNI